ncbi:MAG TPA: PQQ-binding-like beta-propeller repeat protein [Pirellulales bacterium]|nr:PQQ-binding-like beta-propeller repeat protein [Pirellulales bacterium]
METERILWRAWARVGCCGLLALLIGPDLPRAWGQNRPGGIRVQIRRGNVMPGRPAAQDGDDDAPDSVFYPPDRETLQKLSLAKELIEQERYGEAVRLLSDILESPEDYFFQPDRQERNYRSLKGEAQRLLGAMPAEGKASYELQFGAEARRMLDAAVDRGDLSGVAEVSRKYFHTRAGYEATYLLGVAQLQRGEPLAAALSLGRLQATSAAEQFDPSLSLNLALCWARAGRAEPAVSLLKDLNRRMPDAAFRVAGAERKGFASDAQARAWLAEVAPPGGVELDASQWSMYRGSPSRNAPSAGSSPLLNRRWSVPVADHPRVEELLGKLAQDHVEQSSRLLPGLHPLAVRDYVFMRSLTGLVGVDFHTGKRIWVENEKEQQTNSLVDALAQPPGSRGSAALANWLERRVWDSAVYGTLASDGEMIYCIDEPDQGSFTDESAAIEQQMHRQMLFNPRPFTRGSAVHGHNRLVAYEIASQGKLVGEIDTRPGDIAHALSGGFFLGPPLPLGGRLYVLAEVKGEIRLFVLDPKKLRGDSEAAKDDLPIEWSQQLVVLDPVVFEEPLRRLAGATPSFSDGILVCPTSAGAVVAVDLTTRSLLWGYQYPRAMDAFNRRLMIRIPGMQATGEPAEDDRWADASVTIADGHVLLSPLESSEIYCLSLTDGTLRWHKPRDDGLYIACVYDGKAVIVGSRSVKALKLADGESAWPSSLALPAGGASGSTPSGRGFYNNNRYYLPLSSAEVVAIDLDQGQIVARSRSRTGTVPGNLICYQGAVISQGVDHVESFYQLDELRQQVADTLANAPDDAEALARQGELLLDEGKFDEAVTELRRSYERQPDPRTRELLVDGMLESLRLDFARHRKLVGEIERLADQPAEHAKLARLLAGGLQETGEIAAAFDAYLRMVDLKSDPQPSERVESGLSVRRDRWVRARLSQLYDAASADDRQAMQTQIAQFLAQSGEAQDPAMLKRFVGYFAYHPLADEARQRLAEQSLAAKNWLEAEHWLRQLERSAEPSRQRAAVARLAQSLCDAGRPADARVYYEQLAGRWADEICLAGRRGREIARDLAARPQVARHFVRDADWPQGKVEIQSEKAQNAQAVRSVPIEFRGSLRPFFEQATIEVDANMQQNTLLGRDSQGREQWRLPLRDRNDNMGVNPSIDYVRADGHLVVLSLGYQLVGIDTLGTPNVGARTLWKHEISESLGGLPRQFAMNPRLNARFGMGAQRMQPVDSNGRPVGNTSPITSELICFQRMRELMAVDPLTGEIVWTRHDVPSGCELFGDEELLFAVPPGATEAIVLRALDGEDLGRRELPVSEKRMLTRGRLVLDWEPATKGKGRLRLLDVWKQNAVWTKEFDGQARFHPAADEAVAVLERNGHLTVLSLADGEVTIDEKLPVEKFAEVYLLRSPQIDVVVVNRQQNRNANLNVMPAPMNAAGAAGAVINGMVYGFDRQTGKKLWGREVVRKAIALNRPADLPVVLFAGNTQRAGRMPQQLQGELAVMDKRTGKMLLEKKVNQIMAVDATCDLEKHEVTVHTPHEIFRLTFTNEPDTADAVGKKSPTSAAGRAVWRALRNQLAPYGEALDEQAEALKEALGIEDDDPFAE